MNKHKLSTEKNVSSCKKKKNEIERPANSLLSSKWMLYKPKMSENYICAFTSLKI